MRIEYVPRSDSPTAFVSTDYPDVTLIRTKYSSSRSATSLPRSFQVKSGPRREELVGGSVVMGEGSAGPATGGNGRGGGKETERERLARRLKERSHSRRAGSKGAKTGRC